MVGNILLNHALIKLTFAFESMLAEQILRVSGDKTTPDSISSAERRALQADIPRWCSRVSKSSPRHVTQLLLDAMRLSRDTGQDVRFQAQSALLEMLVGEGLAMDLVTFQIYGKV